MIEFLNDIDQSLFQVLNSLGSPWLDQPMIWLSSKLIWIPLYLFLIYVLYLKFGRQIWVPLVCIAILITFTDQFTSSFMKPFFERLRPCHDPSLQGLVIIVDKCGGKFGFASSHAANTMGLAFFFFRILERSLLGKLLLIWAFLVGYSRIYLGVHYPGDVLVGFIIGILGGKVIFLLSQWISSKTSPG